MNEIMDEINNAFKLISGIPVQGDFVEVMALAKEHLRKAFAIAEEKNKMRREVKNDG